MMDTTRQRIGATVAVTAALWAGGLQAASAAPAAMPEAVDVRPGGRFPLAGDGCARPGVVRVELRGTNGGTRKLPVSAASDRLAAVPDDQGRWRTDPLVPADVAPGAYPAVPVCFGGPAGAVDLPAAVKLVRVAAADHPAPPYPKPVPPTSMASPPTSVPSPSTTAAPGPPTAVRAAPRYTG